MPADDREQNFERALARHLRSASPDSSCPDAEILAAYQEGTLSLDQMADWKEHIAGCARCQESLALVEQTEQLSAGEWEHERALHPVEQTSAPAALVLAGSTLPRSTLAAATASSYDTVPAQISKGRPHLAWRWVAPLGLAAAAVIVWVGVQEIRTQHFAPLQKRSTEIAENRETASPPPASRVAPRDEINRDASAPKPSSPHPSGNVALTAPPPPTSPSATVIGSAKPAAKLPPAEPNGKLFAGSSANSALGAAPAPVAGYAEKEQDADQVAQLQSDLDRAKKERSEKPPVPAAAERVEVQTPTHNQAAAAQVTSYQNQFAAQLITLARVDPHYVVAPGNLQAWRLGGGGMIDHSADAGKSWQPQMSGVASDLTSGSAPADKVCWVVGKAGTILVTTDAGKHWKSLTSPIAADLGGIHATDAMHASVWDTSNRNSFETADGGATWTRTANE